MKKSLFFEQKKPLTVLIIGGLLLLMSLWFVVTNNGPLSQIVIMGFLGLLLTGYTISYEITSDFRNKQHFKIFGLTVFKSKLDILFPEYIVVFSARFKQSAEWGPVGALGSERKGDSFVVRLFKGNRHFTVYKTKSQQRAKDKATQLSKLIGVEIRGKK